MYIINVVYFKYLFPQPSVQDLIISIVQQIMQRNSFDLDVPNRNDSNQIYIEGYPNPNP